MVLPFLGFSAPLGLVAAANMRGLLRPFKNLFSLAPQKNPTGSSAVPARPLAPATGQVVDLETYALYSGTMPGGGPEGQSPVRPLYTETQLAALVTELRARLAADASPEVKLALAGPFAAKLRTWAPWYQRIDFADQGLSSTSNPGAAYLDEGSFNRLHERLTSAEACLLRPWPKWLYLKPLLPDLRGKEVMEIGSSHGFFSFRFTELGARQVRGIEVLERACASARWSAEVLGFKNVIFECRDFLLDPSILPADIVFLSEVHNHFLFPFMGLSRLVALARELVILETTAMDIPEHGITLSSGWTAPNGQLIYHSFHLSQKLVLDYLNLIGVPPARVVRYQAFDDPRHVVYFIDTREVQTTRRQRNYPEYLWQALELDQKSMSNECQG